MWTDEFQEKLISFHRARFNDKLIELDEAQYDSKGMYIPFKYLRVVQEEAKRIQTIIDQMNRGDYSEMESKFRL